LTLSALVEISVNNNTLFSNFTSSILNSPSFTPTPNSKLFYNEHFHANQYLGAGGRMIYLFNDVLHLRTEVYSFFPIKSFAVGDDNTVSIQDNFFDKAHFMASGSLVWQSHFGPVSVESNYYDKVGQKWFFSVNMGYVLFNKRGF
jgi:NTE family protein